MRIRLSELKSAIRRILKEESDRPTISSDLDPGEKEFKDKFPKWGNPQSKDMKRESPAQVKAKQVTQILQAKGLTKNAVAKKKVVHELLPFIEKMDPADAFVADPDDIASQFAKEVLGVQGN